MQHNQACQQRYDYGNRHESKCEIVRSALPLFQKVREEKYQGELCHLGGLQREARELYPSVRIRRCRQEKDQNQEGDDNCERGKDDHRMPVGMVVDFHDDEHDRQPKRRRDELFEGEIIRVAESLLRDDCRRTEHHGHAEPNEDQRYEKEDAIRF